MLASFFEFVRTQFYALDHHHQVIPMDAQRGGIFIKTGQLKAARFKLLVVNHHPGVFHVKDLHDVSTTVDENEYPAIANILVHRLIYYAAQSIEALSHIYRQREQVVLKGLVQMEHTLSLKGKQGSVGGQDPGLALFVASYRWDIPLQATSLRWCSWIHEPVEY